MHSNKRGEQYGSCMEVDNTDKAPRLQIREKKTTTVQQCLIVLICNSLGRDAHLIIDNQTKFFRLITHLI